MEEKLLSISQMAKLRHLTSETLRHYDRIGLIKPTYVDPKTKYRYYSIRQYEKIGTIKELRQLGMALPTIVEYFSERNIRKSKEILENHRDLLCEEIREKSLQHKILCEKIEFIVGLKSMPPMDTIGELTLEKRSILTFGEPAGGPKEHALILTKLEGCLHEVAPILAGDRVGVYGDERLLVAGTAYIPAIPMLFLKEPIDSPYCRTIPGGRYLSMYYHNGKLEQYHPSYERLNDYIKEHGLEIVGAILQIYKLDVTLTNDPEETVIEIQIPVK